jgi:hypothetical protein
MRSVPFIIQAVTAAISASTGLKSVRAATRLGVEGDLGLLRQSGLSASVNPSGFVAETEYYSHSIC